MRAPFTSDRSLACRVIAVSDTPPQSASPWQQVAALVLGLFVIYVLGWVAVVSMGDPLLSVVSGGAALLVAWRVSPPPGAGILRWIVALFGGVLVGTGLIFAITG